MKTVNIRDAKLRLSTLLADLVPHQRAVSMAADKKLGAIKIKYDPTEEASEGDWPLDAR